MFKLRFFKHGSHISLEKQKGGMRTRESYDLANKSEEDEEEKIERQH